MMKVIATVPKNQRERVQVALTRYHDHDLVDLRVFADNGFEWVPTPIGASKKLQP